MPAQPGSGAARGDSGNAAWGALDRPILERRRASAGEFQEQAMGKLRQSNKEAKKQPLLTPKEKRAAKKARKDEAQGIRPSTTR